MHQEPGTASEDSDFSETNNMPNNNSQGTGIACGLSEPVTNGRKLEDAIVKTKTNDIAADGYGRNACNTLQKSTLKKARPQKMHNVVIK